MKSTQPGRRHINRIVWLAFFLALISTNCVKIKSAPEDLIGIWRASNISYSDTYFEIEKESITFRTKEGDRNSYKIIKIKKEPMQDDVWVLYTIFYRDQDLQKVEFPFYFQTTDRGVIRFKNQPGLVWKNINSLTNDPHNKNAESFLFVCSGNACLSPIAEGLAKMLLGKNTRIESAGLAPIMNGATHEAIWVLMDMYNIDISHHKARSVTDIQIDSFEHIIVLEAFVLEALKTRYPLISDRFTLWDIEDPYNKGNQIFRRAAEIVKKTIERNLLALDRN
jgi:protein-tyrosine phosphatase